MSEGILLPAIRRGALLDEGARLARIREAAPQILSVIEGETDPIALQATLACLFYEVFAQASFAGFYRRIDDRTLAVGPYQGPMGCLRIDLARGVCGAAARTGEVQLVPDVHAFPGHIACDAGARSELVVPIKSAIRVEAVLDLDSYSPAAFSQAEADELGSLLEKAFAAARW